MIFFRIIGGDIFGRGQNEMSSVENVFATPHKKCAQFMLEWEINWALETQGGLPPESLKMLILESVDFRKPFEREKISHHEKSDLDEVVLSKATIINVLTLDKALNYLKAKK